MPDQGFIQLSGNGAPLPKHNARQPTPLPVGPPMRQQGNGGGMPPQQQNPPPPPMHHPPPPGHQGLPPHGAPAIPFPPPVHLVPQDLRPRQLVEVFDLGGEVLGEPDAREQLSSYNVIRLEKASRLHDVDEEGFRIVPSWEKVTRIEQTDISKQQATRRVRELERTSAPAAEKKGYLSANIQRQIEHAKDHLERTDPDTRYHYILAQVDWVDKKMDAPVEYVEQKNKNKRGRKEYHQVSKKHKPKRRMERVSVTAYFKRTPRLEVSAMNMLRDQERQKESPVRQAPPPQPMPPQMMNQPPHPGPPMNMAPQPHPMNPPQNGFPPPTKQNRGNGGDPHNAVILDKHNKPVKVKNGSPRSSKGSFTSDDGWDSIGESEMTPESSVSSRSRYSYEKRRNRSRARSPHHPRPEYFGHPGNRRHSMQDQDFALQQLPPRIVAHHPQRPLPQAFEIQRALEEAYLDDYDSISALRPRGRAVAPAVIQTSSGVRHLPSYEAHRHMHAENIERLQEDVDRMRLEENIRRERESQREREFQREQDVHLNQHDDEVLRGRRMQERLRRDRFDDSRSPGPDRSWPERSAPQYMHHRERSVGHDNPFNPRREFI